MYSRQNQEFLEQMSFLGDILPILGGFGENFAFWGVILVQDLGKIRISLQEGNVKDRILLMDPDLPSPVW